MHFFFKKITWQQFKCLSEKRCSAQTIYSVMADSKIFDRFQPAAILWMLCSFFLVIPPACELSVPTFRHVLSVPSFWNVGKEDSGDGGITQKEIIQDIWCLIINEFIYLFIYLAFVFLWGEFAMFPENLCRKDGSTSEIFHVHCNDPRSPTSENSCPPSLNFYFSSFSSSIQAFLNPLKFQNVNVKEVRICARRSHIILPNHVEV